ncbi:MAG: hypothetical protein AOA65_0525 [Candidatus Bathyarchaeota archaeon BA1]|nr:MAG: hypothetical protein AOA65_0525 [Candidatus Bathyarchaeota archaeon BA1]
MAKIEGVLEQMNKRIAEFREDFNTRLNHMESDVKDLRADIRVLDAKIDRNFRWTLGILIPMWITIILAIIFT